MVSSCGSGKGMKVKDNKNEPESGIVGAKYSDTQLKIFDDVVCNPIIFNTETKILLLKLTN